MVKINENGNEILLNNYNKNENQKIFNEIIGDVTELNDAEEFCSITLIIGKNRHREANFCIKKLEYDIAINNGLAVGDKVKILFFPSSKRDKNNSQRFYNNNNIIGIERLNFNK